MKKFLFLLLPFIWQCNLDSMFEPADLGNSVISPEVTRKEYSIHSRFDADNLELPLVVNSTYSSPSKAYMTEEGYVFYGMIPASRDVDVGANYSSMRDTYIMLEIRDVDGQIKVRSASTTRYDIYTPLDLYNAITDLPTSVLVIGENMLSIGIWPRYSKLTHENLVTTNTSRFNYVNILQSKLYTNIRPEGDGTNSFSFLRLGGGGIGNTINSSASTDFLKTIVAGSVWSSVNYPDSLTPLSTSYYFLPDSKLNIGTSSTPPPTPNYYGWDIWTSNVLDDEGYVKEHYLYIYRELKLVYKTIDTTSDGEKQDLLKLVFHDPKTDVTSNIFGDNVFGHLMRLSIAP